MSPIATTLGKIVDGTKAAFNATKDFVYDRPINVSKKALLLLMAGAVVYGAQGAMVEQEEPVESPGNGHIVSRINLINDDSGAIYNSAQLRGLNQDISEQIGLLKGVDPNGVNVDFDITGDGNVYTGWDLEKNVDKDIDITNNNFWYDEWNSSSGSNTMAVNVNVDKNYLDLDNNGYVDPRVDPNSQDAFIELNPYTESEAHVYGDGFEASVGSGSSKADIVAYDVVTPEFAMAREVDNNPDGSVGNGFIGIEEVIKLSDEWLLEQANLASDYNGDGKVNLVDFAILSKYWNQDVADPVNFYQNN